MRRLIRLALSRYRTQGGVSLLNRGGTYLYQSLIGPVATAVVDRLYDDVISTSTDLKKKTTPVWELPSETTTPPGDSTVNLDELLTSVEPTPSKSFAETRTFQRRPDYLFKEPFVTSVSDVSIAGPRAATLTAEGKFLADTHDYDPLDKGMVGNRLEPAIQQALISAPYRVGAAVLRGSRMPTNRALDTAAVLYQHWPNYYHWHEHLLKLRGVRRYEAETGERVTLIIPSDPPDFVKESLTMLGYDESRWTEWKGGRLHVDTLVVPSFPEFTPGAIAWLRDNVYEAIGACNRNTGRSSNDTLGDRPEFKNASEDGDKTPMNVPGDKKTIDSDAPDEDKIDAGNDCPEWIYISRQKSDNRRIKNYDKFTAVLDKYGVKPVYCEDLSYEEQIRLFSTVNGVIGVTGAGFTNILWGTDLTVIVIFNKVVNPLFETVGEMAGHQIKMLTGTPVGDYNRGIDYDILVDPDKFEAVLADLM